jgi:hypothetical protein
MPIPRALLVAALLVTAAAPLRAQAVSRPWADWRTIETEHFRVHYPVELAAWTEPMAARLESVHEAVTAFVGYTPTERITVIVEDPANQPNGFAWPGAAVVMWPTPPDPEGRLDRYRGWGEILSVHELAHVVHLTRPTRNPRERLLYRLLPVPFQPIIAKTPRWATEGYATVIEGRLTGSGRPHAVGRPTILRQWALEGKLPTYERLSSVDGFLQGEMAYLVGSAFLEWLVERSGDESLPHLWRRLTARKARDFDEAFAGVFGGPPQELYGRFTVDVTERALAAAARLETPGLVEGELIQRLEGWTADLAVSPDGRHVAVVRQPEFDEPAEIVIWSTAVDTLTTEEREAEARAIARDPEDVPDVEWRPRPKRAVARLAPVGGRSHSEPRWLPDGERILVVRWESGGDGVTRPDLFAWRWRDGDLRRITRGAGIREAAPDPDGATAVGHRCLYGACDLVRVDLVSGAVTVLAAGEPDGITYAGARVAPDGRIVASVRREGTWRIELLDRDGGFLRRIDPDDGAVRSGPSFLPGGEAVVAASDRTGVLELERIDLEGGAVTPLTRSTGASVGPEPDPAGAVWYLSLTTHGFDLKRIRPDSAPVATVVTLGPELAPVAPVPPVEAPVFRAEPVASRPYGIGHREHEILPRGHWAPEGWSAGLAVHGSDPVGRLGWVVSGMAGEESAWRGGSAAAVWRGWRPKLQADVFWARQRPSEQALDGAVAPLGLDLELAGGALALELRRDFVSREWAARIGAALARIERPGSDETGRALAYGEVEAGWLQARGDWRLVEVVSLHGSMGATGSDSWQRGVARARVTLRADGSGPGIEALYGVAQGGVHSPAGPGTGFEAFAFGGVRSPLIPPELLSQRLEDPAVPVGYAFGEKAASVRVEWVSGGVSTYYRWIAAGRSIDWKRVTGIEAAIDAPALPLLGLPAFHLVIGLARSLDPPFEGENRFYLSLGYRP